MKLISRLTAVAAALMMMGGGAVAASKVTLAIGGASCLCYLPTVLAKQIGAYEKAGVDVNLVDFKGGSQSLTAVLGGSADVVSGYFDHTVELAAKKQHLEAFVIYDRYPGLVLVVSPKDTGKIKSVKDLAGKKVGVSAPGSSTDFFLKYQLVKAGLKKDSAAVIGVGLGATAIAAMEQGQIDAAVMLDPAVTVLQNKYKDLTLLADTRTQKDTERVFGGDYPGGAFYTRPEWIKAHPEETQALTNAMVATLKWIHSHSAQEVMDKMPPNLVGADKASYLAALKNTIPMYSTTGLMDPKGAEAVLDVFKIGSPDVAKAKIDITKTYTNAFVEKADKAEK
ncbi:MAG TPA: ABC transporter substrate-binding protein [Rhizobiaceae bacterium]|nr:ABC transporter substrate-binding protein [Rhizobiaceae bacterium]